MHKYGVDMNEKLMEMQPNHIAVFKEKEEAFLGM